MLFEVPGPLHKLIHDVGRNTMVVWESLQEAFQTMKNMISSTPVIRYMYYNLAIENIIQYDE